MVIREILDRPEHRGRCFTGSLRDKLMVLPHAPVLPCAPSVLPLKRLCSLPKTEALTDNLQLGV